MLMYDLDKLVSPDDIAVICNVGRPAVSNWIKRHDDFPKPVWRNFRNVDEVIKWHYERTHK